jgi:hypothetical protein
MSSGVNREAGLSAGRRSKSGTNLREIIENNVRK